MWWAMKLARGEKMVKSEPRSFMNFNWFASSVSRISSSLIFKSATFGAWLGLFKVAICFSRQSAKALGAVV